LTNDEVCLWLTYNATQRRSAMRGFLFAIVVGLGVFGFCCGLLQAQNREVVMPWVGPEGAPTESGIGPFGSGGPGVTNPAVSPAGPTGPVNFLSHWGQLDINTGSGLEASSEFTLFSGRIGGFPGNEGIAIGCSPQKGKESEGN
jgi:hypothetical protein